MEISPLGYAGYILSVSSASDGSWLYLGWTEFHAGGDHVYIDRVSPVTLGHRGRVRVDGGLPTTKNYLSVAATPSGRVYAAWAESMPGGGETIRFTGSQDGGLTWGAVVSLDDAPGRGTGPVGVAVDPGAGADDVFVIWQGNDASGRPDIYLDHVTVTPATAVPSDRAPGAAGLVLTTPRPNPVRSSAVFHLARSEPHAPMELVIRDVSGRGIWAGRVASSGAGTGTILWDARSWDGARVPPGVYFATVTGRHDIVTRKFLVAP